MFGWFELLNAFACGLCLSGAAYNWGLNREWKLQAAVAVINGVLVFV